MAKKYIRRREFVTHSEARHTKDQWLAGKDGVWAFIDCHYTTLVAMIRLHDPFQVEESCYTC